MTQDSRPTPIHQFAQFAAGTTVALCVMLPAFGLLAREVLKQPAFKGRG